MEAVQQTVIHLDRAAMPSQAQMAYSQRNPQIHGRNVNHGVVQVPGENGPYKPSAGTGQVHNNFVGYPANIRYVSQPVYMSSTTTASNVYRDTPFHSRALNISDRGVTIGVPFELARSDMMPTVARQNRISLLSATSDYYQRSRLQMEHYRDESLNHNSHNTVSMNFMRERPDHGPPPPLKKPKLLHPISPQPPLKIDISDPPSTSAYNPQVEAISPTIDEPMPEYKVNKVNDITPKLNKIESDINSITQEIEDLIKLKENYEQKELNSEVTKIEPEEDPFKECEEEDQINFLTPVQRIYASNRKKALESRMSLEKFANKTDLPLYNQPSDADIYHENRRKYSLFKSTLLEHLRKKKMEQLQQKTEITETYSKLYKDWIRRVEKVESSQKRKAKEAKHRELFEKVFPELRKAREDKERFNRVGARIKSEADLEEIMDGLQEQEMEDKKMRSYAVIPPLLLDPHERHLTYLNNNGLVLDYKTEYNERKYVNIWTQQEKEVFKDRFIAHPKNFGAIASYLDKKCPSDCVQYYYLSKPKEEYKRLLRKAKWQARRRTAQNRTPANSLNSLDILNSTSIGVTTRLQRERQGSEAASSNLAQISAAQNAIPENEETPASVEVEVATEQGANNETENCENLLTNKDQSNESVKNLIQTSVTSHTSELKPESKKKERRKDDKLKGENTSTTDEELMDSQHETGSKGDVPKGMCAVCKAENVACPRTLNPSDAAQYGVKPEDIIPGARVCNTCRCKVVRSQNRRVIYCPLPSCPTVQSNNRRPVKRLRPLPAKWNTAQDIIASEFQIGPTTTKCCSACFNRIQRRLMALGVVGTSNSISTDTLDGWTDEETNALKKGIREHGTRWSEISKLVGQNKSHYQCKEFYFSFRKKLGLDLLVQEYKKTNGSEQKPALTDEEESGSSTSSCDETNLVLCDSDTQSAPSPTNTLPQLSPPHDTTSPPQAKLIAKESRDNENSIRTTVVKEDYDSSATETADEGIGGTAENESNVLQHSNNESEKKEKIVTDLSVSDILSDVIEKQFTKEHSNREKENGSMPTISSILLDPEYPIKDRNTGSSNNENKQQSMATISVVPPPPRELHNKDGLVVVQVQSSKMSEVRVPEGVTLDLSIKRPREGDSYSDPLPMKHAQPPPPPGAMYRTPPTQIHETNTFYSPQYAELGRSGKQGEIYWTKISPVSNHVMVHPSQAVPHVTVKQTSHIKLPNKVTSPQLSAANVVSSKLSPNILNNSKATGSIMHGTPVSAATLYMPPQSNRYSQPPQAPGGSITQGTPVHQRMLHNSNQNMNADYYQKRNPQPQYQSRQPHYSEQRQIIMNDYITSQQMHSNVAAQFPRVQKPPVTSPMYYQPTRQGVIQRHNTAPKAASPQTYPPGHEALGSLVDVAIRQPSLPVPLNHSEDRHREQDRYVRGSPVPKPHMYREQQRHEHMQREREIAVQREREMQAVAQIREQQQREQYIRDKQMMHHRLTPEQHSRMVAASFQQQQQQQQQQRQQEQPRVMQIPSTVSSFQQSRSNTPVSRHQEPPSNIQNRDNAGSGRVSRQGTEPHALTAANLIDAIITHQINQSNDGNGHPPNAVPVTNQAHVQQQRAGDKLFQSFPEANEKQNLKPRASPEMSRPGEPYPPEHPFKEYPFNNMLAAGFEPHTWKLRRALQQKEFEQQMKDDNSRVRFYPTQADIPLSPLDYVKNRIVEVMRTSDDDNKNEQAYTYPFSAAINMSASATQKNNESSDPNGGGGGSMLTTQYEPMSDED